MYFLGIGDLTEGCKDHFAMQQFEVGLHARDAGDVRHNESCSRCIYAGSKLPRGFGAYPVRADEPTHDRLRVTFGRREFEHRRSAIPQQLERARSPDANG